MNNLFQQGGIPVPTQRPYPSNQMAQPIAPQNPTAPQQPRGLFSAPNMSPQMRNLMIAAGTSMGNRGQGFGQTLMALQQQGQESALQQKQANMTAKWLEAKGADPQLVQMANQGMAGQALQLYQASANKSEAPSSVREYEYAKSQGFTGTYMDFANSKRASTTINVGNGPQLGKLSTDYTYLMNPDGTPKLDERGLPIAAPVPGSPAALDIQKAETQRQLGLDKKQSAASVVVEDIDRALEKIDAGDDGVIGALGGNTTAGIVGYGLSAIPGTDAHNTNQLIKTVKANAGFDKLQAMRDASPTGGALGQVSNIELDLLNSAIGNLEQSQDPEQLKDNLRRVKNIYLDIIHGQNAGPTREQLSFKQNSEGWQDLGNGVRIREKR